MIMVSYMTTNFADVYTCSYKGIVIVEVVQVPKLIYKNTVNQNSDQFTKIM